MKVRYYPTNGYFNQV